MSQRNETKPGDAGFRAWRRVQLASDWPKLLTALVMGVALPVAAGFPDHDLLVGDGGRELGVVIVMVAAIAGLFLALASLTDRRPDDLLLATVVFGVAVAHPGIDSVFGPIGDNPLTLGRAAIGAAAAAITAVQGSSDHRVESTLRTATFAMAAGAIALHVVGGLATAPHLPPAAALLLALALILGGSLAHIRGVRTIDGALITVGVLTTSAGLGTTLSLLSGQTLMTVGVAIFTLVCVLLGAMSALMAFFAALERRDLRRDAQRLAKSLELARLTAESRRHAELAHDQRTALLAIEAAALQLRTRPSDGLAAAVATEAARLKQMLDGASADQHLFDVEQVLSPVVTCLAALYGSVSLTVDGPTRAWGRVDDIAEVVRALIDNAHEHGREPVSIALAGSEDELVVRVHDSGDGVPDALTDVIFGRGVTSDPTDHSGLGLFVARRLARDSGGDLVICPDDPTTFELRLATSPPDSVIVDLDAAAPRHVDLGSDRG